jgi:hypothetical protein
MKAIFDLLQTSLILGGIAAPVIACLFRASGLANWRQSIIAAIGIWISVPSLWAAAILATLIRP